MVHNLYHLSWAKGHPVISSDNTWRLYILNHGVPIIRIFGFVRLSKKKSSSKKRVCWISLPPFVCARQLSSSSGCRVWWRRWFFSGSQSCAFPRAIQTQRHESSCRKLDKRVLLNTTLICFKDFSKTMMVWLHLRFFAYKQFWSRFRSDASYWGDQWGTKDT